MRPIRFLLTLFVIFILPAAAFAARGKVKAVTKTDTVTVNGSIISAETNKPVPGAVITFFSRTAKEAAQPASTTNSDSEGRFSTRLATGSYTWIAKADGYGLFESSTSVSAKKAEPLSAYLRKAAALSGRLVDGNAKPMAGIKVQASRWSKAASGSDGRFTIDGLDARGYEPKILQPGWVLEKGPYLHLDAGQKKDLGDMVLRRAAALNVNVIPNNNKPKRPLDNINLSLSGSSIYRSAKASPKGFAIFRDLPPGRYTISVSDERLDQTSLELDISEGENRSMTLQAQVKAPTLNIEDYTDVFLPESPFKVRVYGLWADKAVATISAVDSNALVAGRADLRKPDEIKLGLLKKIKSIPVVFKIRKGDYTRNSRIAMPALQPGPYLLEVSGNGATARFGFLVTRLGLVAKTSPGNMLLFATDLISGKAQPGVQITAQPGGRRMTSGADGLANWGGTATAQKLSGRMGDNLAFLELPSAAESTKASALKGYIYTDRPAYRPGQTLFFKGVLRQRAGEGYQLPDIAKVHVNVSDSGDKPACEIDLGVTASGSFHGECVLPPAATLGGYSINASAGSDSWQGSFKVLEYRKPEFEVKLTTDRRFVVAGDTAQVKLASRYYFGAAVAGAKVNWRIYTQPAWGFGRDDSDSDSGNGGEERDSGGYSDFIAEGELQLDGNGEAMIPLTAKSHDMPYTYTIEADVTDISSRQVSSSAQITVVPSLVALNVKAGSYLAKPGTPVDITIKAGDWEGAPKSLTVNTGFEHQVYDRKSRSYSWKRAASINIRTAADGSGRTSFTFPHSGYWQIKAEALDPAGRKSTATTSVWVWKEGYNWEGSYRDLEMELDRKSYKPGETARLIVRSPDSGGTLLLTLEGRDIQTRRTIQLKSMVEVIELPVTEAYAPIIQVSAVTVVKGRFFNRTLPLRIDHQPGKLGLTVKPDKPVYAPGDTVRLTVSASSAGKPVPAELSLAVVDEAIFAVSPERRDDIYQFFLGNREHLVNTLHSFPRVYLGGAAKDAAAFQAKEDDLKGLKIRKTFKDTAYWQPMLTSNADGSATAEFTLPDNLTAWRATAVGHTDKSEFGAGREKFIARLELMARLSPPRFMTVGDELKIPAVITSMTDKQQSAKGRLETLGLTLLGDGEFSGEVSPRGTLRRDILVRADKPGSATLRLLAKGAATGDAMELNLPLLERGITRTTDGNIALHEQESVTTLVLPDRALPGSALLRLNFSQTIASGLNSAISRLIQFPYGCVEQTLSRFIPAVHAGALLSKQAWQPDDATREKLPQAISEGLKRLEEMQHEDGGWGWWKGDSTSLTMTSHALYGLGLAKQAGVAIPEEMLEKGLKSLESQIQSASTGEISRAYRALCINGKKNPAVEKKILSAWKNLPLSEQLAFGEALGFSGQKSTLAPLLDDLKHKVQSEGTASYMLDKDSDSWWYGWRWGSSAVETTASMLSLLVKQQPGDPINSRLAGFLARRQVGGWWKTTASSAAAVIALSDYVSARGEANADYTATLSLNNSQLATYRVENGRIVSGEKQLTIPAGALKSGSNSLKLVKNGNGSAHVSASLQYSVPPEAADSSAGLKLERSMYRIRSVKTGNKWRREYTALQPGEPVAPGDDIEVRLTMENSKPLEYLIIEDRLAAGFESRETDRDPRFLDESGYFSWFTHKERRDDKIAFFITSLPAGRHEFRHVVYPELEGSILALPASVWPMYQPELRGESTPWQATIKGR